MAPLHSLFLLGAIPLGVLGADVLSSSGYSMCGGGSTVQVERLNVTYDRTSRVLSFDVAGSSSQRENVTAELTVTAYGTQVYQNSFSPCDVGMTQMCPVPATNFSAHGNQTIPQEYADQIPSIAFSIPDLDGDVKLQIFKAGTNDSIVCLDATVTNGKTVNVPAVKYVGVGVAGAALIFSGAAAVMAAGQPGVAAPSPTFGETVGWFQAMAMNGMLSVNYPQVYQTFATNFGFSTGLFSWDAMQRTIDNFRASTGGNLTDDNYDYLKNATLVFANGATGSASSTLKRRALDVLTLFNRDGTSVSIGSTTTTVGSGSSSSNSTSSSSSSTSQHLVSNLQAYVEQLMIPQANTFMTLLLIFAIVIAGIIVLILLMKALLELWALAKPLPKWLESWRKRYWWRAAKAIINLILILYSVWTMYCIYQFTNGDSWAAKLLAAISLGLFTVILIGFVVRIWFKARQFRKLDGDVGRLYEDKETWIRYSLFYDSFKRSFWWLFIPFIVFSFARGAIIAGANGHGLVQTIGGLAADGLLLILLIWTRPYQLKSGNIINILIAIVRVLSLACILVFVEELNVNKTTQTITGLALIIIQAVLTGLLAILIVVNSLIFCIRENPHRRRRKQAEKLGLDYDGTDAHNSLLMRPVPEQDTQYKGYAIPTPFGDRRGTYDAVPGNAATPSGYHNRDESIASYHDRNPSTTSYHRRNLSRDGLLYGAAGMGHKDERSRSPSFDREPRLPRVTFDRNA